MAILAMAILAIDLREPVVGHAAWVGQQCVERAVVVAPHHARHAVRGAQRRACAISEHDQVVQAQAVALWPQQLDAALALAQIAHRGADVHVDGGVSARALVQRAEEHASAQAEPVHPRVKPSVLHVQHDRGLAATQRPRADAVDARAMSEHVLQQPRLLHSVQGAQADGLQANALAHRPRLGRSLEKRYAHTALREVQRCGAASEARADDSNAQRLTHAGATLRQRQKDARKFGGRTQRDRP